MNVCPSKNKHNASANVAKEAPATPSTPSNTKALPTPTAKIVEVVAEGWSVDVDELVDPDHDSIDEALSTSRNTVVEIYDSGATNHMTPFRHMLFNYRETSERTVHAAGQTSFPACGLGDMKILASKDESGNFAKILLRDVLYAPAMTTTLVSLGRFDNAGLHIHIANHRYEVSRALGALVCSIPKVRGLYRVYHDEVQTAALAPITFMQLHERLGHISFTYMRKMLAAGVFKGTNLVVADTEATECTTCLRAKAVRKPIAATRSSSRSAAFGDLIHMDI